MRKKENKDCLCKRDNLGGLLQISNPSTISIKHCRKDCTINARSKLGGLLPILHPTWKLFLASKSTPQPLLMVTFPRKREKRRAEVCEKERAIARTEQLEMDRQLRNFLEIEMHAIAYI